MCSLTPREGQRVKTLCWRERGNHTCIWVHQGVQEGGLHSICEAEEQKEGGEGEGERNRGRVGRREGRRKYISV